MKRWMLAALFFATPAFAARMNSYASQLGGANLVQLVLREFPLLATTCAGTPLQSANSGVLILETNVAPSELSPSRYVEHWRTAVQYSCRNLLVHEFVRSAVPSPPSVSCSRAQCRSPRAWHSRGLGWLPSDGADIEASQAVRPAASSL
jgi:hypothetical protein